MEDTLKRLTCGCIHPKPVQGPASGSGLLCLQVSLQGSAQDQHQRLQVAQSQAYNAHPFKCLSLSQTDKRSRCGVLLCGEDWTSLPTTSGCVAVCTCSGLRQSV